MATRGLSYPATRSSPVAVSAPILAGVRRSPRRITRSPLWMSSPCRERCSPGWTGSRIWTATLSRSVCSTMTTASAPLGRDEPVATCTQTPAPTRFVGTVSACSVSMQGRVFGRNFPAPWVSWARTAYPSMAARSTRGTGMRLTTSKSTTRPVASRTGRVSVRPMAVMESRQRRSASSREMRDLRGRMRRVKRGDRQKPLRLQVGGHDHEADDGHPDSEHDDLPAREELLHRPDQGHVLALRLLEMRLDLQGRAHHD